MKRQIEALALVSVAKEMLAGSSYAVRFVVSVKDYMVWAGKTITDAEWKVSQYGRPSEKNIKTYVERYNASLEPDGVNSHLGRGASIYGAEIIDQTTGEVVAQWEDRKIMMAYRGRPMFEVVAKYPDSTPTEKERKLWREQAEKRRRRDGIRPRKAGDNTEIIRTLIEAEKAIMECRSDVTHQVFTREELMEIRKQVREIVLQSEMLDTACGHAYRLASEEPKGSRKHIANTEAEEVIDDLKEALSSVEHCRFELLTEFFNPEDIKSIIAEARKLIEEAKHVLGLCSRELRMPQEIEAKMARVAKELSSSTKFVFQGANTDRIWFVTTMKIDDPIREVSPDTFDSNPEISKKAEQIRKDAIALVPKINEALEEFRMEVSRQHRVNPSISIGTLHNGGIGLDLGIDFHIVSVEVVGSEIQNAMKKKF